MLTSPDGRELILNVMRPGDYFGELGLLTGRPRSADAIVRQAAELIAIPRQAFLDVLECEPRLARRLLETTAYRLSRTSESQNSLAFLDAQARLARVLLEMDRQNEEKGYITPAEFRRFCDQTVPLARMEKRSFLNDEPFVAEIEVAHFGPAPLKNARPSWTIYVTRSLPTLACPTCCWRPTSARTR